MNFQVFWVSEAEEETEPNRDHKVAFQEIGHEQGHS